MPEPTVLLAEDHEVMGLGLRALLEKEFKVYGPHADGATLADTVATLQPDLLVLDLSLRHRSGMSLIEEIRQRAPDTRILIHTLFADHDLLEEARRLGAHGYVGKDAGSSELLRGIEAIREGLTYFSPLIRRPTGGGRVDAPYATAIAGLTDRRQYILELIGEGLSTEEVAARLGVTERTIYYHRSLIRQTLGVESEEALERVAVLWRQAVKASATPTGKSANRRER